MTSDGFVKQKRRPNKGIAKKTLYDIRKEMAKPYHLREDYVPPKNPVLDANKLWIDAPNISADNDADKKNDLFDKNFVFTATERIRGSNANNYLTYQPESRSRLGPIIKAKIPRTYAESRKIIADLRSRNRSNQRSNQRTPSSSINGGRRTRKTKPKNKQTRHTRRRV